MADSRHYFADFVDTVRNAADIVAVISEYVPLKKRGHAYWGCCPFHNEKTPSFSVSAEKGLFFCFGCQTGGNVFNFLMKIENMSFIDAVKHLAHRYNIEVPEPALSREEFRRAEEKDKLLAVNDVAAEFFHACLTKTALAKTARDYLAQRGISGAIIEKFRLGYAPPAWDKLVQALTKRGCEVGLLLAAGLALQRSDGGIYDRFRDRIMFPIYDLRGRTIGFGGRVIGGGEPKYLNSPETLVFRKRSILFALNLAHEAIRQSREVIVVEGYMDAITAHAAGLTNVVASLGTSFSPEQAKQLLRYEAKIYFAYDMDAAGRNATLRALEITRDLGATVKVISMPEGKDPDEYIRRHGPEAFKGLVEQATGLLQFQLAQIFNNIDTTTLEGKVKAVREAARFLASSPNAVEVDGEIARLAENLKVSESAVRDEVRKARISRKTGNSIDKKDKNYNEGNNIYNSGFFAANTAQSGPKIVYAERQLIRMLVDRPQLIPRVQEVLTAADLQGESRQEIINSIYNAYNMGKSFVPSDHALSLSDQALNELSGIMMMDGGCENSDQMNRMLTDCVKTIKLARLRQLYEQHRLRAHELEKLGDMRYQQELEESKRINDEMARMQ